MPCHNSWEGIEFTTTNTTITNIMETTIPLPSSLLSNPLFSTLITLSLLVVLYFPNSLLGIFLSPLLISTSILLFLLRFGTSQQRKPNSGSPHRIETRISPDSDLVARPVPVILDHHGSDKHKTEAKAGASVEHEPRLGPESFGNGVDPHCCYGVRTRPESEPEPKFIPETVDNILSRVGSNTANQEGWAEPSQTMGLNLFCEKTFVGWEVGAPLEVIYEAYEGDEEEEECENVAFQDKFNCTDKTKRYPSLSRCYPESDSDSECSSSSWEGELWDGDQDDREELIEIALDYYGDPKGLKKKILDQDHVQVVDDDDDDDEDNLLEIDICPPRYNSGFC